jgi:hypothetical protein
MAWFENGNKLPTKTFFWAAQTWSELTLYGSRREQRPTPPPGSAPANKSVEHGTATFMDNIFKVHVRNYGLIYIGLNLYHPRNVSEALRPFTTKLWYKDRFCDDGTNIHVNTNFISVVHAGLWYKIVTLLDQLSKVFQKCCLSTFPITHRTQDGMLTVPIPSHAYAKPRGLCTREIDLTWAERN